MICSVRAVDGVPVQMPQTKDEIKDLARRIGNDGLAALQSVYDGAVQENDAVMAPAKN